MTTYLIKGAAIVDGSATDLLILQAGTDIADGVAVDLP